MVTSFRQAMEEDANSAMMTRRALAAAPSNRTERAQLEDDNDVSQVELNEDIPIVILDSDGQEESEDDIQIWNRKRSRRSHEEEQDPSVSNGDDVEEACSICFENFTTVGVHRLVSIKCGHFFGENCIRRWMGGARNQGCPNCKAPTNVKDIRQHFTVHHKAVDNSGMESLRQSIDAYRRENETLRLEKAALEKRAEEEGMTHRLRGVSSRWTVAAVGKTKLSREEGCRAFAFNGEMAAIAVKMEHSPFGCQFGIAMYNTAFSKEGEAVALFNKKIRTVEFSPFDASLYLAAGEDNSCVVRSLDCTIKNRMTLPATVFSGCWSGKDTIVFGLTNGRVLQMGVNGEGMDDLSRGEGRVPIIKVTYLESFFTLLIVSFKSIRLLRRGSFTFVLEQEISEFGKVQDVSVDVESACFVASFSVPFGSIHFLFQVQINALTDEIECIRAGELRTTSSRFTYMWRNVLFPFGDSLCSVIYQEDLCRILFHHWNGITPDVFRTLGSGTKVTEMRATQLREDVVRVMVLAETEMLLFHLSQ